jgi:hypothetical protein
MTLDVDSPRPARPLKRALEPDYTHYNKRHRPSPPDNLCSKVPRPSSLPSSQTLAQLYPVSRQSLGDIDPRCTPRPIATIHSWLSTIPDPSCEPINRPSSAPAGLSGRKTLVVDKPTYQPSPFATIKQMFGSPGNTERDSQTPSRTSSQTARLSISNPIYRSILFNNHIYMDLTGNKIPAEVRTMINGKILKERTSQPLPEERAREISTIAEADTDEISVSTLVSTMSLRLRGIGKGGATQWSTEALPHNFVYGKALSAPKPDLHYGYATGQLSEWSIEENAISDYHFAQPYTQPAIGNKFPFLVFELKLEAIGGTLWHAENQAAGSGACCVNGMLWLLQQAAPDRTRRVTDCIAFSVAATQRETLFYVHYYVEEEHRFYMSFIQKIWNTDPADIRRCHDLLMNIFDYGLTIRQQRIKDALALLYSVRDH